MAAVNKRMQDVLEHRRLLLARISGQREQVAELASNLKIPLQAADRTWGALRFFSRHALLIAGVAGIAGMMLARRRGVKVMLKGAWRTWKAYRFFKMSANSAAFFSIADSFTGPPSKRNYRP